MHDDNKYTRPLDLPDDDPLDIRDDAELVEDEARLDQPLPQWAIQLLVQEYSIPIQMNIRGKTLMGRSDPDSDYQPDIDLMLYGGIDKGVSRQHAELIATRNQLLLVDLESTNGTRINGKLLRSNESYRLHHGDRIQLGMLEMQMNFAMVPFHEGVKRIKKGASSMLVALQGSNDKDIRRILVVEDNEDIAAMFGALLRSLGYEVTVVNNTQDAMQEIEQQLPHAIFLDSHLSDISGTEVCVRLRNDEKTRTLPIFMLSEDTSEESVEKALEAGADMFLSKPVGMDELLRALFQFVGDARPGGDNG